jgi:hypothetical protein
LHYGVVAMPCRIKDPIAKGKWNPVSDTLRKHRSRDSAAEEFLEIVMRRYEPAHY